FTDVTGDFPLCEVYQFAPTGLLLLLTLLLMGCSRLRCACLFGLRQIAPRLLFGAGVLWRCRCHWRLLCLRLLLRLLGLLLLLHRGKLPKHVEHFGSCHWTFSRWHDRRGRGWLWRDCRFSGRGPC